MKALAVLVVGLSLLALACSNNAEPASELRPREPSFNSVFFIDESTGWLAAYLGEERGDVILATSDGGETWEEQYSTALPHGGIGGIRFVDRFTGWAVMSDSPSLLQARIILLGTNDAGETWTELGELGNFFAPQFVSHNVGWGRTWNTAGAELMQTTDGGRTWKAVPTEEEIGLVCFANELHGWTAKTDGTVLRTDDGGQSWESVFSLPPEAPDLHSAGVTCRGDVVWVSFSTGQGRFGSHAIFSSTDSGDTWNQAWPVGGDPSKNSLGGSGSAGSVHIAATGATFMSNYCGPCNGGSVSITRTDDSGATWEPTVRFGLDSSGPVSFPTTHQGWIVGTTHDEDSDGNYIRRSVLLRTVDGGTTWTEELSINSENLTLTFR